MRGSKLVLALLFMSLFAQVSFAQMYSGGTGTTGTTESFNEIKARILKMIEERKARIAQEKACVEAATNDEELKKCRPMPPMGGMGGMGMGRGQSGMQGSGMQGRPGM
jgi:hypothetical protein